MLFGDKRIKKADNKKRYRKERFDSESLDCV